MALGRQFIHNTVSGYPHYHVYALFCRDGAGPGYVKIGHTMYVGGRLTQLRTACPVPAKMFATAEIGAYKRLALDVEKALHKQFHERRISGEWFLFDFTSEKDKRDFNDGSMAVFTRMMGRNAPWWTKVSVPALDAANEARRKRFCRSRFGRRLLKRQDHEKRMGVIG